MDAWLPTKSWERPATFFHPFSEGGGGALSVCHPRCMGINPKKSSDPIIACLSITRSVRNTDVLKIQRRAPTLSRETPKSVAIRERFRLRARLKSLLRATRAEIKLDTMFAFEITTTAGSRSVLCQNPWRSLYFAPQSARAVVVKAKLKKLRRGKRKPRIGNLKTNRATPECGAVCKRI
ncbi:hypothetical protein ALC62_10195 [Cyphomyrmex costatus]|uniref:Uncharacterized protein n=1 Tax=Cyphomyrmex costatus TaxID=456900 RepID=A0A195CFJ0_9HYME|nr:hypothetical protein ALC62_10195 [Cyphomyrmex costatus]